MTHLQSPASRFTFAIAAAAAGLSLVTACSAEPLTLVEQGNPRAAIVVAGDEPHAAQAAEALQEYILRMSGAELPVVTEGEDAPDLPVRLCVGHTEAAAEAGIAVPAGHDPSIGPDAFEEEGYVLKTVGNTIFIGGNSDGPYQGTLFAAYDLLQRLGCRWYFPGEWGELVPATPTLTVPHLEVETRPDFAVRSIWLSGWIPCSAEDREVYAEWCVRNRFSGRDMYPVAGDGFLGMLLPANEYWEDHPEFYAMDKQGDRKPRVWSNGLFYDRVTMLCMSNTNVLQESIGNLRAAFAGEREMRNVTPAGVGISPPDGAPFCYCEDCLAASQGFDYPRYVHERMQSEEFFGFACKLADEFPDKYVATMAYSLREMPPQGLKLRPNMAVTYAPISCCVMHPNNDPNCWRRLQFTALLRQWRRQTPHLMIYDYNPGFLLGLFVPERDVANMAVNVPIYKEIDIKGMAREGRKAFMQTWISYYVTARLLWDAEADVEAIVSEFYTTFFGPQAGPHVRAWWQACEEALLNADNHAHEDWLINHIYTVEFVTGIHEHVEKALSAEATPEQRARIETFALIADHLQAYAEMEQADRELDYARAAAAAERMHDRQKELHAASPFLIDHDARRPKPRPYFAAGRKLAYDELAAKTAGALGELVAELPPVMRFMRDPFNEGVIYEWYRSELDDTEWEEKDTFLTWDQQDPPEDAAGHDYDGYGWYRGRFFVPNRLAGQKVVFHCGGAINEAWVWINGKYAGHKPHRIWWHWGHDFELDVSSLLRPDRENTIAIRVWNDAEIGGLYRRGFFYTPVEAAKAPAPEGEGG